MRVVTYNIHGCRGIGGFYAPNRVAAVLQELSPDIAALQEVDTRRPHRKGLHQFDYLARETGLGGVEGPAIREHHGEYGNALLTRLPIVATRLVDLSVPRREPRGAIDVDLAGPDGPIRVIVTHLGLGARERGEQIDQLLAVLANGPQPSDQVLLMGDFNEWWLGGRRRLAALAKRFAAHYDGKSFPAAFPLLSLDRIFVHPAPVQARAAIHRSAAARRASDHLPLMVDMTWPGGGRERAVSASPERSPTR